METEYKVMSGQASGFTVGSQVKQK
jgi:hypothetical protein